MVADPVAAQHSDYMACCSIEVLILILLYARQNHNRISHHRWPYFACMHFHLPGGADGIYCPAAIACEYDGGGSWYIFTLIWWSSFFVFGHVQYCDYLLIDVRWTDAWCQFRSVEWMNVHRTLVLNTFDKILGHSSTLRCIHTHSGRNSLYVEIPVWLLEMLKANIAVSLSWTYMLM